MEGINLPPYLIKKIFPPKECVTLVDTTDDGQPDSILLSAINWIMPFSIPDTIDLGDFDLKSADLSEYGRVLIDGEPLEMYDIKYLINNASVYFQGIKYTFGTIINGAAAGKTIAVGDKLHILLKIKQEEIDKLKDALGKHELKIEGENIPNIAINFQLSDKNMNVKFDPSSL